jgi:hypothetical protein
MRRGPNRQPIRPRELAKLVAAHPHRTGRSREPTREAQPGVVIEGSSAWHARPACRATKRRVFFLERGAPSPVGLAPEARLSRPLLGADNCG